MFHCSYTEKMITIFVCLNIGKALDSGIPEFHMMAAVTFIHACKFTKAPVVLGLLLTWLVTVILFLKESRNFLAIPLHSSVFTYRRNTTVVEILHKHKKWTELSDVAARSSASETETETTLRIVDNWRID